MAHIVIDARIINSSTGHYVEFLLHYLQQIDTTNHYTVLIAEKDRDFWKPSTKNFTVAFANQPQYSLSEQLSLARQIAKLRPDLVHFCMPQQPLLYFGKRVTTIHDTTLIRYDNIDGNRLVYKTKKLIFRLLLKNVLFRSKAILTPSAYVREDLIKFSSKKYGDKIHATLLAGDGRHTAPVVVPALEGKNFLFYVGNAFPYKNLRVIIDGYRRAKQTHPDLVLVFAGKIDSFYEKLKNYVMQENVLDVHFLGYISDGQKTWLFQNARCYVTASLSEGFHMPLLEAMENDCPILSSTATCLPEVAGNAALFFDPKSPDDLAASIDSLLDDPSLRTSLIERGGVRQKDFSWQKTAQQTYEVYQAVLKNRD